MKILALIIAILIVQRVDSQVSSATTLSNNGSSAISYPKLTLRIDVLLQDKSVQTNSIQVHLQNLTTGYDTTFYTIQTFTLYFIPDCNYNLAFTHAGFNSKLVHFNTTSPKTFRWDIELTIRLYNNKAKDETGYLYYDKRIDNFNSSGSIIPN